MLSTSLSWMTGMVDFLVRLCRVSIALILVGHWGKVVVCSLLQLVQRMEMFLQQPTMDFSFPGQPVLLQQCWSFEWLVVQIGQVGTSSLHIVVGWPSV